MKIAHPAFAGTLESSDLQVRIEPNNDGGIELVLDSTVAQQFGHAIRQVVLHPLDAMQVRDALVTIAANGALDWVSRARVQAAVMRACDVQNIEWSPLSCPNFVAVCYLCRARMPPCSATPLSFNRIRSCSIW